MNGRPGVRRLTAWDDTFVDFQSLDNTRNEQLLVGNVADPEKRGCTLIRLILGLHVVAAAPGAASGMTVVSVGIQLSSDDAFTASAVADADQTADFPVSGWMYRDNFVLQDHTSATGPPHIVEVRKDLRAARKMDRSTVSVQMHNNSFQGAAFTVRIIGLVRALYKLP